MKTRMYSLLIGLVLALLSVFPVQADGIIVPEPPPDCIGEDCFEPILPRPISQLVIRYHHVDVDIENQVAEVRVDQEFYNPNDWAVEGFYIFPLPTHSTVSEFTLWVDGEPVKGEILDAQEARKVYEDSVHRLDDPALLEYIGQGAIKASVFPIPPNGSQRITLKYFQILDLENGLVNFEYPLNTEKFSTIPLEEVKIQVNIQSDDPIRAVYSLSHEVQIRMDGESQAQVSYQEENVLPDKDFELSYSAGQAESVHLFSYMDSNGELETEGGYFALLIAPPSIEKIDPIAKDILFVLDRSGSMEGEKFEQAQAALIYILRQLNPDDRFYLTTFNDTIQSYSSNLMPVSSVEDAVDWVEKLSAGGSTDINRALLETISAANSERPTYLIFLTDGLPTQGEVDPQKILNNFYQSAPDSLRAFVFGVGYDVDTYLLDTLSEEHHGDSTYVKPEASLKEVVSGFYNRISAPVLTDVALEYSGVGVYDVYPRELPDLFAGSQLIVLGRYRDGGAASIVLSGTANGERQETVFEGLAFDEGEPDSTGRSDSIPRLWATRKIGYLLKKIRLKGTNQELVDQIIQLSIRYGIVTPYTSFLVTEPNPLGDDNQVRLSEEVFEKFEAAASQPAYGMDAFERAAGEGQMAGASVAAPLPTDLGKQVKIVGDRAFLLEDGVWTDTLFDPENMKVNEIAYLSKAYFEMVESSPQVAAWFALGKSVIVVKQGVAYQIVEGQEFVSWHTEETGVADKVMDSEDEELWEEQTVSKPNQDEEAGRPEAEHSDETIHYAVPITAGIVVLVLVLLMLSVKHLFNQILRR